MRRISSDCGPFTAHQLVESPVANLSFCTNLALMEEMTCNEMIKERSININHFHDSEDEITRSLLSGSEVNLT